MFNTEELQTAIDGLPAPTVPRGDPKTERWVGKGIGMGGETVCSSRWRRVVAGSRLGMDR